MIRPPEPRRVILYEYPLHERIRTYLRVEHLYARLSQMVTRMDALDHHFALVTLFDLVEVAGRADLKADLLKDLDRTIHQLSALRDNPAIAHDVLDRILAELQPAYDSLNEQAGKSLQSLVENDWLKSIRSRIGIPAGTCEFDLPAYFAWQHRTGIERQHQLQAWMAPVQPLVQAVHLVLRLLRDAGTPRKEVAGKGLYVRNLPQGRNFLLMRVAVEATSQLVPEISGNRLMVSVRLMRVGPDLRLTPVAEDTPFEVALCA